MWPAQSRDQLKVTWPAQSRDQLKVTSSVTWPAQSHVTSPKSRDQLKVMWPAQSHVTSSKSCDQLKVTWPAQSHVTSSKSRDQPKVTWPAQSHVTKLVPDLGSDHTVLGTEWFIILLQHKLQLKVATENWCNYVVDGYSPRLPGSGMEHGNKTIRWLNQCQSQHQNGPHHGWIKFVPMTIQKAPQDSMSCCNSYYT